MEVSGNSSAVVVAVVARGECAAVGVRRLGVRRLGVRRLGVRRLGVRRCWSAPLLECVDSRLMYK